MKKFESEYIPTIQPDISVWKRNERYKDQNSKAKDMWMCCKRFIMSTISKHFVYGEWLPKSGGNVSAFPTFRVILARLSVYYISQWLPRQVTFESNGGSNLTD